MATMHRSDFGLDGIMQMVPEFLGNLCGKNGGLVPLSIFAVYGRRYILWRAY